MGRRHEANETIMTIASMQIRPGRRLASALLPLSIALALAACGGGGGNVRPTPPPPTTPTGPGFTPTVDNDSSLTTLNPPAIPAQGVPVSLTDASINRHLSQVAARVGDMAQRSYMPIIGIVENMSYFVDSLGVKQYIFGKGGGEKLAKRLATQLVAQIPIDGDVSQSNFEGTP